MFTAYFHEKNPNFRFFANSIKPCDIFDEKQQQQINNEDTFDRSKIRENSIFWIRNRLFKNKKV
jgi:hypothetical protein